MDNMPIRRVAFKPDNPSLKGADRLSGICSCLATSVSLVNQHCRACGFHHVDNAYISFNLIMYSRTPVMVICADMSGNCSASVFMLLSYIFCMIKMTLSLVLAFKITHKLYIMGQCAAL